MATYDSQITLSVKPSWWKQHPRKSIACAISALITAHKVREVRATRDDLFVVVEPPPDDVPFAQGLEMLRLKLLSIAQHATDPDEAVLLEPHNLMPPG